LADSNSVKLATYNSWFAISDAPEVDAGDAGVMFPAGMPGHVQRTSGIPMDWLIQLVRLRTGGHHLAIETGRWSDPPKPRAQRLCRMCAQNVVEDEMHFMFECTAYDHIRQQYADDLFQEFGGVEATVSAVRDDGQMWRFLEQDPRKVARFVYECSQLRRSVVEADGLQEHDESTSELVSTDDDVV
jgi:hypothetical protein